LLAEDAQTTYEVEVTSLNPPDEDAMFNTLSSMIMVTGLRTKCAVGGVVYISHAITPSRLTNLQARLSDAALRAQTEATCIWVNEPVVVDGNLITSRKPDDLPAFCRAIIASLVKS